MPAGKLRNQIEIQRVTVGNPLAGQPAECWSAVLTAAAEVTPLSGQEYMQAQQMKSAVSHRVRLRWIDGIDRSMRVKLDGRILHIESVINVEERGRWLELMCRES